MTIRSTHNTRWTILVVCSLLILPPRASRAQVPIPDVAIVSTDQSRPGLGWRKVHAPHFDVVFPAGLGAEAQRVARTLEALWGPLGKTMGAAPGRLTVVLQNESVTSNAYAALGPRRSVWITTPPAFGSLLGTGDWLTLLSAHETRHIAQLDRTDVGTTRLGRVIVGDLGWMLLSHLAIPGWMWEGDAVVTESAMSTTGRARSPEFTQEIRALALAGKLPGYYEAMLGSYNDFFPNQYALGYMLTSYLRRHEGDTAVADLFRSAAAQSLNPFAFHTAMRRGLRMTPPTLYERAMQEADSTWRRQILATLLTEATRRSPEPRVHTNFEYPQLADDGSMVALRRGFANLREVVRVSDSGVVALADAPTHGGLRLGGHVVAWTQTIPDLRWGLHENSAIRLLDIGSGVVRSLGHPGRYAFPAPSPDGSRVAAIELARNGGSAIIILDARSGARTDSIAIPGAEHAMSLAWRPDGNALVFTRQGTAGKALTVVDLGTRQLRDVIAHGTEDVTEPAYGGRFIYFASPISGTDNIYALDPETGARFRVTSRAIGAHTPAISRDGRRLLFAEHTLPGTAVYEMAIDSTNWDATPAVAAVDSALDVLVAQERFVIDPARIAADTTTFPVKRIGLRDRYNVHSWSLAGAVTDQEYGASLLSTDVFNTIATQLTYVYNAREASSGVAADVSYAGLFPIFDAGVRHGTRSSRYTLPDGSSERVSWTENGFNGAVRLPFTLSRGYWYRAIEMGVQGSYTRISDLAVPNANPPGNGTFVPLTVGATFVNQRAMTRRDLAPRNAQSLSVQWRRAPRGDFHPEKFLARSAVFLPTPARHHMLRFAGGLEAHHVDQGFAFSTSLPAARGYDYQFAPRMVVATADYELPIAYPDKAFGPLAYIPRLTAGVFADYTRATGSGIDRTRSSAGVELKADIIPFTWDIFHFSMGVRAAYRSYDRKWVFEGVASPR